MFRPDQFDYCTFEFELINTVKTGKRCLLLEGNSDKLFFKNILNENREIVVFCLNSSDSKKHLVSLFENNQYIQNNTNVLGIVDRDLDINNILYPNLITTRFNDLENYFIQFTSFKYFVYEYFNNEEISVYFNVDEINDISMIRDSLYLKVINLTKLRKVSSELNLEVPLGKVLAKSPVEERKKRHKKVKKIINEKYEICSDKLVNYVYSNTKYDRISSVELCDLIKNTDVNNIEFCTNGHDLITILAVILNCKNRKFDDIQIEELLRLTVKKENYYEFDELANIYSWVSTCTTM